MALDADFILDRRRLKRSILRWRVLAGVAVVIAIVVGLARSGVFSTAVGPYIAEVTVEGVIASDPLFLDALDRLEKDDNAVGVIVHIDSPGGTMVGGEELYESLRRIGKTRPIVAEMGTVAASGGYMTAIAADHILAHRGTITGSIGVIFQSMNVTGALEKLGVEPVTVKSAPLKAAPNPFEPTTEQARDVMKGLISDMFNVFVSMVAERRDMTVEQVKTLADGRVYTGQQAVANGLIDAIGGRREALQWLEQQKGIASDTPVVPMQVEDPDSSIIMDLYKGTIGNMLPSEGLKLDGLLTVWHP
ncbi:peptidase [Thalassospira profundimaris]|uniref:Peptidase n=1 Tax=Thalassospira profundimaris TaxID=502049 RepID=A0A367WMD8_9PROT|nr:signal peptide peptidase SppA [Thalassospira profundimaris]RCK42568.1 peptidase [Thalassospira profundimaris]